MRKGAHWRSSRWVYGGVVGTAQVPEVVDMLAVTQVNKKSLVKGNTLHNSGTLKHEQKKSNAPFKCRSSYDS